MPPDPQSPTSLRTFYLKRLWDERSSLIPAFLCAAVFSGSQALIAKLGGEFTDIAFIQKLWTDPSLQRLCLYLVLLIVLMATSEFFHKYMVRRALEFMIQKLRNEIFAKYLSFSESVKSRFNTGTAIHHLISDINLLTEARTLITELVKEPMTIAALLGTLFYINWKLCLLCFAAILPIGLMNNYIGRSARRNQNRAQLQLASTISITNENFRGMRTVHSLLLEQRVNQEFRGLMSTLTKTQLKLTKLEESVGPLIKIFSVIAAALILYVGAKFAFDSKTLNAKDLTSFIIAAGLLPVPLRNLSHAGIHLQRISAGAQRIYDLFHIPFDSLSFDQEILLKNSRLLQVPRAPLALEALGLSFSYPGTHERDLKALTDINFKLDPGKKIALVGKSGAGKSTLALMSMRYMDPQGGSLRLGDKDARKWDLGEYRSYFSYVSQEVYFFQGSVRENLERAAPKASETEMWEALEIAQLRDRFERLPQKLNTPLSEAAANLSGGEKQRLGIARALLRSAPILVLDEATSSLDSENEQLIQQGLEHLMKRSSSLVIAHRLSTVMNCDEVLVMDHGSIVERGSPKSLREGNSRFSKMWERQSGVVV